MITVRHIERLWDSRKHERLLNELIGWRVEALVAADLTERASICAAALALIRLDELNQPNSALAPLLIRMIASHQEADGGWGDIMATALCVRALSLNDGHGDAMNRAVGYLANLQQPQGIWPRVPIRRLASDATVSAFVLLQLGDNPLFRVAVRIEAAQAWFQTHPGQLDVTARRLWDHARLKLSPIQLAHAHSGHELFQPSN